MQIEFLEKSFIPPKVFCARWCCFNIGFGKNVERLLPKIEKAYHFEKENLEITAKHKKYARKCNKYRVFNHRPGKSRSQLHIEILEN